MTKFDYSFLTLDLIIYLSVLLITSVFGIGLYSGIRRPWRLVVVILVLTTIVEVAGHIHTIDYETLNLLYQIYTPLSFGLYILVFRYLHVERVNILFSNISLLLVCIVGVGLPFINKLTDFPSLSIAICSLILIINSLVMFRDLMKTPEVISISRNPRFVLSTSILVYWGLFFFRHGLYNSLISEHNGYTIWLDDLHLWLSVLYYITLAVCIRMSYNKSKTEDEIRV